jgi:hypothetical protein
MYDQEAIITEYKKRADRKRVDASLELSLLDDIRKGNGDAIVRLVDSWEQVILSIIENELKKQIDSSSLSIEKMFNAGRSALIGLAEKELGSTSREIFSRFGAWSVRQTIIKELA